MDKKSTQNARRKANRRFAGAPGSAPSLSLKQMLECMVAGWRCAAYTQRSVGRLAEAKTLEMCADTLAEEMTKAQNTEVSEGGPLTEK